MSNHDQLLQQADRLRNTCRDWLDEPAHSQARNLQSNIERFISDIRAKKPREALDADLKNIINALERVDTEVMDDHHSDQLRNLCEDLRRQAQGL